MITIIDKKECCGCSGCAQICPKQCITLREDVEGFLYPHVDLDLCIDCGKCERVCPVINQAETKKPLKIYAAQSCDLQALSHSSSGGIFSHLAQATIARGGVLFGAAFDDLWQVRHTSAEQECEIAQFRGSKYLQSVIGNAFSETREALQQGREVLFSGTPCHIAALKLFLGRDYDNLFTVDVLCHGVPSPKVWRGYLHEVCRGDVSQVKSVTFREKSRSWRRFHMQIEGARMLLDQPLDQNLYLRAFTKGLLLRPSCYNCPAKGFISGSDVTLGDYWGVEKRALGVDSRRGVSLVMCNSQRGQAALSGLSEEAFIVEQPYSEALKENPAATRSAQEPRCRAEFFKNMNSGVIEALKKSLKQPVYTRIIRSVKIFFYTITRK